MTARRRRAVTAGARAACALPALAVVAPLLAWVLGLGAFHRWFLATTVPAVVVLVAMAVYGAVGNGDRERLRTALVTGAAGGLLGTVGYDLFRVPFAISGLRVFAPIESYGLLLADASSSSPQTTFAGWSFHFLNGIGFGIAYAFVMIGRRWWWGVAWGLVLETVTIVTPFAAIYGLSGKPHLIALAYAAHVAYGYPLGVVVERASASRRRLADRSRFAMPLVLAALVAGLVLWHRPFASDGDDAPGVGAAVRDGEFHPEWLRIPPGGCAVFRNEDDAAYTLNAGHPRRLAPNEATTTCFGKAGVFRVRTSGRAYSGGFVIVDEHASADEPSAATPPRR